MSFNSPGFCCGNNCCICYFLCFIRFVNCKSNILHLGIFLPLNLEVGFIFFVTILVTLFGETIFEFSSKIFSNNFTFIFFFITDYSIFHNLFWNLFINKRSVTCVEREIFRSICLQDQISIFSSAKQRLLEFNVISKILT